MLQESTNPSIRCSSIMPIAGRMGGMLMLLVGMILFIPVTPAMADGGPGGIGKTDGTSSLILWLEADAGVHENTTCTDLAEGDDAVACWADQSGNSNAATQATAGSQPTYTLSALNTQPVLSFDGASDYLDTGSDSGFDVDIFTWFTVFKVDGTSTAQSVLRSNYQNGGGSVPELMWGTFVESAEFHSHARRFTGDTVEESTHTANTSFNVIGAIWDAGNNVTVSKRIG